MSVGVWLEFDLEFDVEFDLEFDREFDIVLVTVSHARQWATA